MKISSLGDHLSSFLFLQNSYFQVFIEQCIYSSIYSIINSLLFSSIYHVPKQRWNFCLFPSQIFSTPLFLTLVKGITSSICNSKQKVCFYSLALFASNKSLQTAYAVLGNGVLHETQRGKMRSFYTFALQVCTWRKGPTFYISYFFLEELHSFPSGPVLNLLIVSHTNSLPNSQSIYHTANVVISLK